MYIIHLWKCAVFLNKDIDVLCNFVAKVKKNPVLNILQEIR